MLTDTPAKLARLRPFRSLAAAPAGLARDLAAGLTLAAIAAPEQMATARLGGFSPKLGLYAFVAASLGFAILGSSRKLSAGADSTITPIMAGGLAAMAVAGTAAYGAWAAALALTVGLLVMLAGLLRLGWMADFLSRPVLTGFLAGIALHIVLSQAPALLGLPEESGDVYHRLQALWAAAATIRPAALMVGLGVFGLTFAVEAINPRLPAALIALAAAALATWALGLQRFGVAVLGAATQAPARLGPPVVNWMHAFPMIELAFIIALLVMVQTAAVSRSFPDEGAEPDVDGDFVGVGMANVMAGLAGGFPVNASPPRTAVVADAGGRSQVSGLIAGALVLLLATAGAGVLAMAPTAALAGILLFVAQRIFRLREFMRMAGPAPAELALSILTALLIIFLPIQTGVALSVFLSLAHGVYTVTRTRLVLFEPPAAGGTVWWPAPTQRPQDVQGGVMVVGFQAPLSFLNAYAFRHEVLQALDAAPAGVRLIVLEAASLVEIDFSAAEVLIEVIDTARAKGVDFAVARLESVRAQLAFQRFGIDAKLGPNHIFQSVDLATQTLAGRTVH